ncbi:hypothetical protein Trydic_g3788 [Trypoxylus dichotomus]
MKPKPRLFLFPLYLLQFSLLLSSEVESAKIIPSPEPVTNNEIKKHIKRQSEEGHNEYAHFMVKVKDTNGHVYNGIAIVQNSIFTDTSLSDHRQLEVCFYNNLPCETVYDKRIYRASFFTLLTVDTSIGTNTDFADAFADLTKEKCTAVGINHGPIDVTFSLLVTPKSKDYVVLEGPNVEINDAILVDGRLFGILYKDDNGKMAVAHFSHLGIEASTLPVMHELFNNLQNMLSHEANTLMKRTSASDKNATVSAAPVLKETVSPVCISYIVYILTPNLVRLL